MLKRVVFGSKQINGLSRSFFGLIMSNGSTCLSNWSVVSGHHLRAMFGLTLNILAGQVGRLKSDPPT